VEESRGTVKLPAGMQSDVYVVSLIMNNRIYSTQKISVNK
jgi:hypothetical protein